MSNTLPREIQIDPTDHDLATAIQIAAVSHANQVDKHDRPYILHVSRVAAAMRTDEERAVAWLHDICEDQGWDAEMLLDAGFSPSVVRAVHILTRDKNEPYERYINRVASNELATAVKIADLRDNLSRIGSLPAEERARLEPRYLAALDSLTANL
jgi:(p)ppGpp synthase/HD superfamily hydrolase